MNQRLLIVCGVVAIFASMSCGKPAGAKKDLLSELDVYHRTLRPLMHEALPAGNFEAFKNNAATLLAAAQQVAQAEIPQNLAANQPELRRLSNQLLEETRIFTQACEQSLADSAYASFTRAHDTYENMARLAFPLKMGESEEHAH